MCAEGSRRSNSYDSKRDCEELHRDILRESKSMSSSVGLDLLLSDFPFLFFCGSSPKRTLPLAGRFLTADAQSVGAGCWPAGTSLSQIRHIPAGGKNPGGTIWSRRGCDCCVDCDFGLTGTGRCASAELAEMARPTAAASASRVQKRVDLDVKRSIMAG